MCVCVWVTHSHSEPLCHLWDVWIVKRGCLSVRRNTEATGKLIQSRISCTVRTSNGQIEVNKLTNQLRDVEDINLYVKDE